MDRAAQVRSGRLGGHATAAAHNPLKYTAAARAAAPGCQGYWERLIDPDGTLAPAERQRRARSALRLHMSKLALKSAKAKRQRERAAKRAIAQAAKRRARANGRATAIN